MSTAVWILLSVAGVAVGLLAGYGVRRRREAPRARSGVSSPRAGHPSTRPDDRSRSDDDGVVIDAAFRDIGSPKSVRPGNGDVIDLRPQTTESGERLDATSAPAEPERVDSDRGDALDLVRPRIAAAATAVEDQPAEPTHDADIIDLRDRVKVVIPVHNLQFVRGIGPELDKGLRREGIVTLADLTDLDDDDMIDLTTAIDGLSVKRLRKKLRPRAREMLDAAAAQNAAEPPDTSELRRVQGIGTTMARWLETREITTLEALAALDLEEVAALDLALTDHPGRVTAERWVEQARRLLAGD